MPSLQQHLVVQKFPKRIVSYRDSELSYTGDYHLCSPRLKARNPSQCILQLIYHWLHERLKSILVKKTLAVIKKYYMQGFYNVVYQRYAFLVGFKVELFSFAVVASIQQVCCVFHKMPGEKYEEAL